MKNKDDPHLPHASYKNNRKQVEKFADPKTLVEQLATHTQELSHAAPNITTGLNTAMMRAQQFLQSKMPLPGSSLPLSGEHRPSRSAMAKFNHYYETINDPVSVFKHVKNGTLKNEHVETLQQVFPHLYDEMKKKIVEHMDPEKAIKIPYGTKTALAKFMGQPMDASMLPQSVMANQAALTGPRLGSQGEAQVKPTQSGLKELSAGKRAATETDRLTDDLA